MLLLNIAEHPQNRSGRRRLQLVRIGLGVPLDYLMLGMEMHFLRILVHWKIAWWRPQDLVAKTEPVTIAELVGETNWLASEFRVSLSVADCQRKAQRLQCFCRMSHLVFHSLRLQIGLTDLTADCQSRYDSLSSRLDLFYHAAHCRMMFLLV